MNKLHDYTNRHIRGKVAEIGKNDWIVLQNSLSKLRWKLYFKYFNVNEDDLNITYITKEEKNKLQGTKDKKKFPFSVVLANSRYSNGDVLDYPTDFQKNLQLAPLVIQVMPYDINSQQVRLKAHNERVKRHMIKVSDNVTDQFNVGIQDIRYVTASINVENEVEEYVDPLDSHPILYPERKRLFPRRGVGSFSRKSNHDVNGVSVMTTIYRGNKLQWTKVKKDITNKVKVSLISDAPYFVLVAENPSKGLFNTVIVKNDGTKWSSGILALDASNIEEAEKLQQWLVSEEIQKEVQRILSLKNTYSMSGPMMEKLPWYE
jgi:hypothetical protein